MAKQHNTALVGRVYLQSIRLAIALVCLGASLILAGHWMGLMPDVAKIESDSRRRLSEAMAVNAAAHVRKQQWVDLRIATETLVDRDEDLLSVGVRSQYDQLKVDVGHHADLWHKVQSDSTGVDAIKVPITLNRRPWGNVEFCFRAPDRSLSGALLEHPLMRLLGFFCVTGLIGYTLFVGKVMRVFSNTQVVPDRVRKALDTLAEGLLVLDEKARIVLANRAFADSIGTTPGQLADKSANHLSWTDAEGVPSVDYPWMTAIDESATVTEHMLHLVTGDKQRIFSVNAAPIGGQGTSRGALVTFRDVTHIEEHRAELETMLKMLRESRDEISKKNRELEILATQDALTGCLNRRAFFDRFGRFWEKSTNDGLTLSCIMIDNDHFKSVNDNYGHAVGDQVLREVARVLKEQHGSHGLVCRYGGEEFCVLLPGVPFEEAIHFAEQTREAIEQIIFESPADLKLTASLGVSETGFGAADPQELINQADVCLYAAKRFGRNQVTPYSEELNTIGEGDENQAVQEFVEVPYQAVTALVATLSYRDPLTARHSQRVADLCARVSPGYLNIADQYLLEIAGLLHDVGKIGVPDHVLLKRGALTPQEWRVMSRYDAIGLEIVSTAFDCLALTDILAERNVFFDGSNRTPGPSREERAWRAGRLLAICDCYDSMVSVSSYRGSHTHEEAIAELRAKAGTQFDPALVEHFASTITEKPSEDMSRVNSQAAIELGFQAEDLAAAIERENTADMQMLAERMEQFARTCDIESISSAAVQLQVSVENESGTWFDLLQDTNDLLDLCRATQADLLKKDLDTTLSTREKLATQR